MQQAYQFFNSGKYKQALNALTNNPTNIDSYEPNICISEYMANRSQQLAISSLRKLNELLSRRNKREGSRIDPQTENIIKLNIAVLMILQGRRESALLILKEVYKNRSCFIQFMQTRVFLLLMELNSTLKNSFEVLELYRYYLLRPAQPKTPHQQWMSVIFHEHGKTFAVVRQQFNFIANVAVNQALMQMGAPANSLTSFEDDDHYKQDLIGRIKRRKNGVSKYYQINVMMINRFLEAQKQLYSRNYQRCLSLMNFVNMSEQHQQMPTTKIITNILNGFATSNTGIIHYIYKKPSVAFSYFAKARILLTKASTGVQDRQLHLLSLNYGNYVEFITFNQALSLLGYKPRQAFQFFDALRKSSVISKNYKFWYRTSQAILQYYHDTQTPTEQKKGLLQTALNTLMNALSCLEKTVIPSFEEMKPVLRGIDLESEEIEAIILKLRGQINQFKSSVYALICYVCLGLKYYRRVIGVGKKALEEGKMDSINRLNILYYVIEAEISLGKTNYDLQPYLGCLQQEVHPYFPLPTKIAYSRGKKESYDIVDYETVYYFQNLSMFVGEDNFVAAEQAFKFLRHKYPTKLTDYMSDSMNYLSRKFNYDKKQVYPFRNLS